MKDLLGIEVQAGLISLPKLQQETNQTCLTLFEIGDKLCFTNNFLRKEALDKFLPLYFIKYQREDRDLCLCLDNEGDFITVRREFLTKEK